MIPKTKLLTFLFLFAGLSLINSCSPKKTESPGLEISNDGHYLLRDGKPYFWLADTGWYLFTLSPDDVDYYFQNRVKHQFNTIQMMVINRPFHDPDYRPNFRGDIPFESTEPLKLNEKYFEHIDLIIEKAEQYNLVMVLFPIWGQMIKQIFSVDDPDKIYEYGYLLGKRYRNYKHVIWSVSGEYQKIAWVREKDNKIPNPAEMALLEHLAQGLEAGHRGKNLMTIHPDGWKSSSEHFHDASWLDFNMVQSYSIGKGTELDILNDYRRIPYKPTLLAEPGYEYGGAGHRAFHLRYEGYHSLLNGAFGYTYGCESIWQMNKEWKNFLDSEGATQMKHIKKLFESRPIPGRIPAPDLIKGNAGDWIKLSKMAAARSDNGAYAFIYFPSDTIEAEIRVCEISGMKANAWWYNPRDGETYDNEGEKTDQAFAQFPCNLHQTNMFNPPGEEGGAYDWILILDDMDKGFKKP